MEEQIPLWDPAFNYFVYIPRTRSAGSFDNSIFNFLRYCNTVFHSGYAFLYSHQQYTRFPFSPHPRQHFFLRVVATLMGKKWYLTVLICNPPGSSDVEHLFMCLLSTCITSLKRCPFKYTVCWKKTNCLFSCYWVLLIYVFWILTSYQIYGL